MPILLPELAELTDTVAAKGSRAAGVALANSERLGGPRQRKIALARALPSLLAPAAGAMSAGYRLWYERQPGGVDGFDPQLLPADERGLVPERVEVLFDWAWTQTDSRKAFEGGIDRWLRNIGRDTNLFNAKAEGARWYRHASANACGFCRMLATRGAVYASAKSAGEGNRYHDHCHCMAVAVRPGDSYTEMPYIAEWRKDYEAARAAGLRTPGEIAAAMDNAPTGKATLARQAREARRLERRQGRPGGPGGSPPTKPPTRGGKGYSDDDEERRLEWELDDAMRRRMKGDGSLDETVVKARELHDYRSANGITGRLDERFGKPFDSDERVIVDKLLAEDRNVSSLAVLRTGDTTPDMVVDGRLAEIKTSTGSDAAAFGGRVAAAQDAQGAPYVFVNATRSGIDPPAMRAEMEGIVVAGRSRYIRVIGEGYDSEHGRW